MSAKTPKSRESSTRAIGRRMDPGRFRWEQRFGTGNSQWVRRLQTEQLVPDEDAVTTHPDEGFFACSDTGLNRVFEAARTTMRLNMLDTYMDCPGRERGGYFHDGYWEALAAHLFFHDMAVNRRMLRQGAEAQGEFEPAAMIPMCTPAHHRPETLHFYLPGHALFWVLQLELDLDFSGSTSFFREQLPAARRLLEGHVPAHGD